METAQNPRSPSAARRRRTGVSPCMEMASLLINWILRCLKGEAPGLELLDLQDDLLREILLRIGSPADLISASAACVPFRRLVTEPSFFRRYRSIHPPLLLGFLYAGSNIFQPAEAPHPNAPAARALYRAATFTFDERLPVPARLLTHALKGWESCDLRDGRVLLKSRVRVSCRCSFFLNLAVCDPLSQRYLELPLVPNKLLAPFLIQGYGLACLDAFLVPSTEKEDEASFRVICMTKTDTKLVVFVFASSSGCWSFCTSKDWDALNLTPDMYKLKRANCAYGCFFWKLQYQDRLLKLDMGVMELSAHDLPLGHHKQNIAIAEAGEGKLALFSHSGLNDDTSLDYYTTTMQNKSERGNNKWQVMSTIPLPAYNEFYICGAAGRFIFVTGFPPRARDQEPVRAVCFSLEVNSLKIERVCSVFRQERDLQPYFGYPPPMSPRVMQ